LRTDPVGFLSKDLNLYTYAVNNPTNSVDPVGLMGTRPVDGIPSQASSLGQLLALDCITKRCQQGGDPLSILKAWEYCLSAYDDFRKAHPEITDSSLQVLGGVDAFLDSCAKRCSKESKEQRFKKKCCKNKK
jgi:hypothetical protein